MSEPEDETTAPPMRGVGRANRKHDEHGIPLGDHRCTPKKIWKVALEAIGAKTFDLDPATNAHSTVPAETICTGPKVGGADGLELAWWGNVWLNFPFSDPNPWVAKVLREADRMIEPPHPTEPAPRSITILGPGDSAVAWWRALRTTCDARAMWPKRLHFPTPDSPKGSAPGPVHLWYFGPRATRWRRIFEAYDVPTESGTL